MSGVPYIFGTATTSIPLSQLDTDFATPVTIGSTAVALGNTTTTLAGLTGVTSSAITDSGLTSGRVTYAGTGGLLQDSANLTFNGTTLTAAGFSGPISGVVTSTSITDSGLTSGRVTYATTGGLLTDSANLTFNGSTLTASNLATPGVVQFSTNAAQAAGSIAKNATYGLTYYGITGSSYDVTLLNNAGNVALGVTAGTQNLVTGSNLAVTGALITTGSFTATGFGTFNLGAVFAGASNNATGVGVEIGYGSGSGYVQAFNRSTTAYVPIYYDGSVQSWNIGGSEKMRLDASGRLGIGTSSPAALLDVNGFMRSVALGTAPASGAGLELFYTSSTGYVQAYNRGTSAYNALFLSGSTVSTLIGGATAMIVDASSNLGLGVTPSAWNGVFRAFQFGDRSAISQDSSTTYLSNNYVRSDNFRYLVTATASDYYQSNGQHIWRTAASGTAGNAITFTTAMTLDASGNLLVGTTSTTGSASNNTIVAGGKFKTVSGSVSAANATATTLFTAPTALGAWLVTVNVDADSVGGYAATYIVNTQGSSSTVATLIYKGTLISVSVSGYNVQATQLSGGTATIQYSAVRIF